MKKKFNIKLLIIFIAIVIASGYFLVNFSIKEKAGEKGRFESFKSLLDSDTKRIIKKYIFPYKVITYQEKTIAKQKEILSPIEPYLLNLEIETNESGTNIGVKESKIKLLNDKILKKYKLISGFYVGIKNLTPGSGYLDFYEDNLFVVSSRGVLAFTKNLNENDVIFRQIKNNINKFISFEQFKRSRKFSIKDLLIFNGKIYISYTAEIEQDCWNNSIIYGDINYERIQFKKMFTPKECVHSKKNIDKEFTASQSGGRMVKFDDSHILFSIGEYRSRHLAQNEESVNGKVIKININSGDYKIISMGHRNPQGLYFDKENNFILETEHGPKGGDEINLIEIEKINKDKIQNYGWAIVSAGEHYGARTEKYPLYKSHSEYGFIEPLKSFVPSIAISEIVKIEKNNYVVSSLKDKSLYFFELNQNREIVNLERLEVFERIRDLRFNQNKLYLFMENTASIGVINLN
tara:strand:+ start:48 stop:1436 length:1389 start_codon:yes stop_codon:yes gene_type:complete